MFADTAGFTALTEAHGDEEAATLAADFGAAVKAELPECDGAHIKASAAIGLKYVTVTAPNVPALANIVDPLYRKG
jgi:class 3 adenylate cyclase